MTDEVLLDTDILSSVMRRDPRSFPHAEAYLRQNRAFTFSIITRYEILRGLKAKRAQVQLVAFERLCASSRVLPISEQVIAVASDLYAYLYRSGELIGDADILIAATALTHNLPLASNNLQHSTAFGVFNCKAGSGRRKCKRERKGTTETPRKQ